jgi:hypothetical protein
MGIGLPVVNPVQNHIDLLLWFWMKEAHVYKKKTPLVTTICVVQRQYRDILILCPFLIAFWFSPSLYVEPSVFGPSDL